MSIIQEFVRDNALFLLGIFLIIALVVGLQRAYVWHYSLRKRRQRALVKMYKAHIELQYVDFDTGKAQLESDMDASLKAQLENLKQQNAVPNAITQAARKGIPTQRPSPSANP
jgi:hypothetical protein